MSTVDDLHNAVKRGDLVKIKALLQGDRALANSRSETDARGTYPLHVAAEFGQAAAAQLLLDHGADVSLLDLENDAIALCWAAFFGRPTVLDVLLAAGSDPSQRNKHGITPLVGCNSYFGSTVSLGESLPVSLLQSTRVCRGWDAAQMAAVFECLIG